MAGENEKKVRLEEKSGGGTPSADVTQHKRNDMQRDNPWLVLHGARIFSIFQGNYLQTKMI